MLKSFLIGCLLLFTSFIALGSHPISQKSQELSPELKMASLVVSGLNPEELSTISIPMLELKTGRKLSAWQKISFKLAQKKLRKQLAGAKNHQKAPHQDEDEDRSRGFHMLGFILGFFLGPIGIILSYFIDKEEERANRVKWAWIGWGISVIFVLLLYTALIVLLFASGI